MRSIRSLIEDERAIEGLPIRLVIALVVGVAALGLMMGILNGFAFAGQEEVDVKPKQGIVEGDNKASVTLTVVTADGDPVEKAQVIAKSGTLSLDSPSYSGKTDKDGKVSFDVTDLNWRTNQEEGTIKFRVDLPGDGGFVDDSPNTKVTVIRE